MGFERVQCKTSEGAASVRKALANMRCTIHRRFRHVGLIEDRWEIVKASYHRRPADVFGTNQIQELIEVPEISRRTDEGGWNWERLRYHYCQYCGARGHQRATCLDFDHRMVAVNRQGVAGSVQELPRN